MLGSVGALQGLWDIGEFCEGSGMLGVPRGALWVYGMLGVSRGGYGMGSLYRSSVGVTR